jgi:hypothetical protein
MAAPAMDEPSAAKKTGTMRISNADVPIAVLPGPLARLMDDLRDKTRRFPFADLISDNDVFPRR